LRELLRVEEKGRRFQGKRDDERDSLRVGSHVRFAFSASEWRLDYDLIANKMMLNPVLYNSSRPQSPFSRL
jgi:hypothetical protein